eukprot:3252646-Amphidinium_carterae.1
MHILRVDDWYHPRVDHLQGPAYVDGNGVDIWVLIHQRHMCALRLVEGIWEGRQSIFESCMMCSGWEHALQQAIETEECSILNQIELKCPHCRKSRARAECSNKIGSELEEEDESEYQKCVSQWGKVGKHPLAWTLMQEGKVGQPSEFVGPTHQPPLQTECEAEFAALCSELEARLSEHTLPMAPPRAATKNATRVRQLHLGAYVTHGRGVTKATMQWRNIGSLIHRLAKLEPHIGDYTTAMVVRADSVGLHRDLHNAGQSWTLSVGNYQHGRLWCEQSHGPHPPPGLHPGETPLRGALSNTKRQWTRISAQRWHSVEPWQGDRWAIIVYTPVAVANLPAVDWAMLHLSGFPIMRLQAELLPPTIQQQFHAIVNKACRGTRIGSCSSLPDLEGLPRTTHRCCSCARHLSRGQACAWCPHWVCRSCVQTIQTPNGPDEVCRCCFDMPPADEGGGFAFRDHSHSTERARMSTCWEESRAFRDHSHNTERARMSTCWEESQEAGSVIRTFQLAKNQWRPEHPALETAHTLQQLVHGKQPLAESQWQPEPAAQSLVHPAPSLLTWSEGVSEGEAIPHSNSTTGRAGGVASRPAESDPSLGEVSGQHVSSEQEGYQEYWKLAREAADGPTRAKIAHMLEHSATLMQQEKGELASVCRKLRQAWERNEGNHLAGVQEPKWKGKMPDPLLSYLQAVAQEGVDARYRGPALRFSAKPHASAAGVQQLAWSNALEDAAKGRVFLLSCHCEGADEIIPSPQGAVEKQNPDRTMSGEYRFINDLRMVNHHCWKADNPPAKQCTHKQLARLVSWWRARLPNVPVVMSKKDVSAAFKLIWLREDACRIMAVQLLGKHWDLDADVYAVYLVLTFGWIGSPGQWQPWGWAIKWHHEAHHPPMPTWHDETPFCSRFLMDDGVLVEPLIGIRAEISEQTYIEGMTGILGPKALNLKKDQLEGQYDSKCLAWGLLYDAHAGTISVPPAKLLKGAWAVYDTAFDPGNTQLELLAVQRLHGILNYVYYYAMVQPALRAEMGSIAALLRQSEPGLWCDPPGDAEEKARIWQEFWDSVELVRVLTARPETWTVTFTNGLTQLLDPHERVEIPGESARVIWLGGDATLTRGAAIDWTHRVYTHYAVQEALARLAEAAGEPDEEAMIALAELQVVVCLTAVQGAAWAGHLVINVTDNMNVRYWVNHRRAKNRLARHLLRLLAYAEIKNEFAMTSTYIRTFNNKLADDLTRVPEDEVEALAHARGLTYCDITPHWCRLIERSYENRVHALAMGDREDEAIAEQLKEQRQSEDGLRGHLPPSPWCNWEVTDLTYPAAPTSTYAKAAVKLGVPVKGSQSTPSGRPVLCCASIAPDSDD